MMMKTSLFVVLISLVCLRTATAGPQLDDKVRAIVEQKIRDGELPSLVIAVRDGDANAVYAFGKVGAAAPDGRTVYEIGSITKTFSGLLLAQAVVAGQVRLDDPLGQIVPAYARLALAARPVTLLDLATQTSGLPRLPGNLAPADMADPYVDYHRAALKAFLADYTLTRAPGSQYEYSNLGTGLLGDVLAERECTSYAALVAERITGPLGMTSTGMGGMGATLSSPAMAMGHDAAGKPVRNWNFDALAGAGALHANADDMLRYLQAMMDGGKVVGSPIKLAQTPQRDTGTADTRIALNWHLSKVNQQVMVWHNGMTGGYASFIGFTEDGRRGVVVLTNTARTVDQIGLTTLFPELAAPAAAATATVPPAILASYAGRFELAPGFVLTIEPAAAGLRVQATGQPAFSATASGTDTFQVPDVGASLTFKRNTQGEVDGVTLRQNGRELPGRKL